MKEMNDTDDRHGKSALAKYGPLGAICFVLAAIILGLVVTSPKNGSETTATTVNSSPAAGELPEGVLPWAVAEAQGKTEEIDWGARCDTTKGVLALPVVPAPSCYAPYDGPSGGVSSTGVTADSIKVVVYLAQENDPVLSFI